VETNTSIAQHRKQVKEDAADAEASNDLHVADCEYAPRHDDLAQERNRHSGDCL
jgi:hypothetical protein